MIGKKRILYSAVGVVLTAAFVLSGVTSEKKKEPVRHVVVFKYKETATEAQIQKITDAFRELQNKIDGIESFEWGTNTSSENLNQDFTHVYLLTFEDAKARDAYLPHPEHKKFGKLLGESGIFAGAFVVDYTPQK